MPLPPDRSGRSTWPWTEGPGNPRTYPGRPASAIDQELRRSAEQHHELVASMEATGQAGALVIARLDSVETAPNRACTTTTWSEGSVTVLPHADVVVLFELPTSIDGHPTSVRVRWDVVARVCGSTCWRLVPGLDPPRVITRQWPPERLLTVLRGLSLPDLPYGL